MPHGNLDYSFDEPLFVAGQLSAGNVIGTASIDYDSDGLWTVEAIYLDAWDAVQRRHNGSITVPKDSDIYNRIHERLTTGKTAEFIGSDVWEAIEEDRQPDPDYERERRRDDLMNVLVDIARSAV